MRVYKCDRCGKYVGWDCRYALRVEAYFNDYGRINMYKKKHLCTECNHALSDWLNDPEAKEEGE